MEYIIKKKIGDKIYKIVDKDNKKYNAICRLIRKMIKDRERGSLIR